MPSIFREGYLVDEKFLLARGFSQKGELPAQNSDCTEPRLANVPTPHSNSRPRASIDAASAPAPPGLDLPRRRSATYAPVLPTPFDSVEEAIRWIEDDWTNGFMRRQV